MSSSDWYQCTIWTPEASAEFEKRLARARNRAEYIRIQAVTLAYTNDPSNAPVAIELARRYLELEPNGNSASQMHASIARARETLGDISGAVESYLAAIELEFRLPMYRGHYCLDFAWFVVIHELSNQYDNVMTVLERDLGANYLELPSNRYRYLAPLAIICESQGDIESARRLAQLALAAASIKKGPFSRHPNFGVVLEETDALRARLQRLAD
jgi:tetratricopeptide (TPR) repeat protein